MKVQPFRAVQRGYIKSKRNTGKHVSNTLVRFVAVRR